MVRTERPSRFSCQKRSQDDLTRLILVTGVLGKTFLPRAKGDMVEEVQNRQMEYAGVLASCSERLFFFVRCFFQYANVPQGRHPTHEIDTIF